MQTLFFILEVKTLEKKKNFGAALEHFFAGKGFYIVLFLCVAVIGISAWTMLSGGLDSAEDEPLSLSLPEQSGLADIPVMSESAEPAEEIVPVAEIEPEAPVQQTSAAEAPAAVPAPEKGENPPSYFVRPVAGQVENGYSMDKLQYNRTMRDWRTHDGLDIAAELGTQVKAAADGKVEKVTRDDSMGTTVVLLHSGGLRSVYSNLAESPTVKEGDAVAAGSVIGSVGSTALSETGEVNHLHFAMSLDGESVDPEDYLP